jgi:hypothetical protein
VWVFIGFSACPVGSPLLRIHLPPTPYSLSKLIAMTTVMSGENCTFVIAFPHPMIIYPFNATQNRSLRTYTMSLVRTPSSKSGSVVIISVSQLDVIWQFLFYCRYTRINGSCTGIIVWKFNFEVLCDFINCLNPATVILRRRDNSLEGEIYIFDLMYGLPASYVRPAYTHHTLNFLKKAAGSGYRTKT